MNRARVRAAAVVLSVFAVGILTGIFFHHHRPSSDDGALTASQQHEAAMAELAGYLDLDDQQVAQIHTLLGEHQDVVQQMWEQLRPEVQTAMQQVHVEIADLLRPDQRALFHKWLLERQADHATDSFPHP